MEVQLLSRFKRFYLEHPPSSHIHKTRAKVDDVKRIFVDASSYCDEASLDAQRLINLIHGTEYVYTTDVREADLIVFYACGHLRRQETESVDSITKIGQIRKKSSKIIVWGCLPKIDYGAIGDLYEGPLLGPESWGFFSEMFGLPPDKIGIVYANSLCFHSSLIRPRMSPTRTIVNSLRGSLHYRTSKTWYIKIESGCNNCCTYCSDRLSYKWMRSQPVEKIMEQFASGLRAGYKYFRFVGRDLGSYGYDIGLTLPNLLNEINAKYTHQDYRIFLHNVSPNSLIAMYPELNSSLYSGRVFEIGSHIQSGSDRILRLMGKNFKICEWVRVIKNIAKNHPEVRLSTSIMVGFPWEEEKDFEETLNLMANLLFDKTEVYMYEDRPDLPSLKLKGRVTEETKRKRYYKMRFSATLNNLRKRISRFRTLY